MESAEQKLYEQARIQYSLLMGMIILSLLYFVIKIFVVLSARPF